MHNDYRFHREKYVEVDVCFPSVARYSRHNSASAGGFVLFADTSSTKKLSFVQALSA